MQSGGGPQQGGGGGHGRNTAASASASPSSSSSAVSTFDQQQQQQRQQQQQQQQRQVWFLLYQLSLHFFYCNGKLELVLSAFLCKVTLLHLLMCSFFQDTPHFVFELRYYQFLRTAHGLICYLHLLMIWWSLKFLNALGFEMSTLCIILLYLFWRTIFPWITNMS